MTGLFQGEIRPLKGKSVHDFPFSAGFAGFAERAHHGTRHRHRLIQLLGSVLIAVSILFVPLNSAVPAEEPLSGLRLFQELQNVLIALADRVKPAVVNIAPAHPPKQRASSRARENGTGVIIAKDGWIVTNHHLVGDAPEVEVRLGDKSKFVGKVMARDKDTDLALIKIAVDYELPTVPFGDSSKVRVGQWVMAVGNSLDRTVTIGVVSGLDRENILGSRYETFIQMTAPINPGDLGGPLFNINGEVIGINTVMFNFAQGMGFAIPSNMVQQVVSQLRAHGKVARGWLGANVQELTTELAARFGVKEREGLVINDVFDNEPAAKAGLEPYDIVTKVDGQRIETRAGFLRIIAGFPPGRKVEIAIIRDGQHRTITVELGERKEETAVAAIPSRPPQPEVKLGLDVQNLTQELADKFKIKDQKGALISKVEAGSTAQEQGLREGDLIIEVNRQTVTNADEFKTAVAQIKKGQSVLLRAVRENRAFYSVLSPKEKSPRQEPDSGRGPFGPP